MAVKLHRCNAQWVKIGGHPCWKVEKSLIDQGIEYERVPGPGMPWQRKQRTRLHELTGGDLYPAIEFEDGSVYREESKDMVATIRSGKLFDRRASAATTAAPGDAPEGEPATGDI
jgi:hypothetical protein